MKRKSPYRHLVKFHHTKKGTPVQDYMRGDTAINRAHNPHIANPSNFSQVLTFANFNQKVRTGEIPIEKVNYYRFWHNDSFQDIPGRTESEAKTILNNYEQKIASLSNITKIELSPFTTQQYRAYLETKDKKNFEEAYLEAKNKRGITKSSGEFWLFKGKEYNNVGIPKNVYLKARAKTERELGIKY